MTKKIKFFSNNKFIKDPLPAKNYIPDWYRKADKYLGGKPHINHPNGLGQLTIKGCMPFLEAYINGYMIELWQDIEVFYIDEQPRITWNYQPIVAEARRVETLQNFPTGDYLMNFNFAWKNPTMIKTPKGYSVLITHPFNRFDLPFVTLTGIVDSDTAMTDGNIPFLLKKGFEGIIPKGTPIAQIIPFKRDNWKAENDSSLLEESENVGFLYRSSISNVYKSLVWKKKNYH